MNASEIRKKINDLWEKYWETTTSNEERQSLWAQIVELENQLQEAKQG